MPLTALVLIVFAAVAHSIWNLLAKRAAKHKHFIWFSSVCEAALFMPLAIWALADSWPRLGVKAVILLSATGILHLLYTESLLRGYRAGDFRLYIRWRAGPDRCSRLRERCCFWASTPRCRLYSACCW